MTAFGVGLDKMSCCWCRYTSWLTWVPWGAWLFPGRTIFDGWSLVTVGGSRDGLDSDKREAWEGDLDEIAGADTISGVCAVVGSFAGSDSGVSGVESPEACAAESSCLAVCAGVDGTGDSCRDVSRCISWIYAPDDSGVVASEAGDADSSGARGAEAVTCEVSVSMVDDWCSCASCSAEAISLRGMSKISKMKTERRRKNKFYKPSNF